MTADIDKAMADVIAAHNAAYHPGRDCARDNLDHCAERAAALAADSADAIDTLTAAGAGVLTEWGYRITYNDGHIRERWVGTGPGHREVAESVCQSPLNWAEPGRPGQLLRRYVITTAPTVVEESP